MSEKQIEDCGCVNFGGGGLVPKYCPKHLAQATLTPQGTTEERFRERFVSHPHGVMKDGKVVYPEFMPFTHENVLSFIESETSLSYQRGQDDLRERMREKLDWFTPVADFSVVDNEATGRAYDAGFYSFKERFASLLKAKESNQK